MHTTAHQDHHPAVHKDMHSTGQGSLDYKKMAAERLVVYPSEESRANEEETRQEEGIISKRTIMFIFLAILTLALLSVALYIFIRHWPKSGTKTEDAHEIMEMNEQSEA